MGGKWLTEASSNPYEFEFDLREDKNVDKELKKSAMMSYLLFENGGTSAADIFVEFMLTCITKVCFVSFNRILVPLTCEYTHSSLGFKTLSQPLGPQTLTKYKVFTPWAPKF